MARKSARLRGLVGGVALGVLIVPAWVAYAGIATDTRANLEQAEAANPTDTPPPPGSMTGTTRHPVEHELDLGRISGATPGTAILNTGSGPRLLRLRAETIVWLEGMEQPYRPELLADGDWAEAAGAIAQDGSIDVDQITLNALGNLAGVFGRVERDGSLAVFPRTGNTADSYSFEPLLLRTDGRTRYFGGRGNYSLANRDAGDLKLGSWVLCNGYRTRAGEPHALECYFGDETPPADAPQALLDRARASSAAR